MRTDTDLIIVGGGAAGLTAAICAARRGLRTTIVEHRERVGKKLLSTGNGRCNLSSLTVTADAYTGSDPAFISEVLCGCDTDALKLFFNSIGVPLVHEADRIYPRTMQAQTVLDALRFETARLNVHVETDTEIISAEKRGDSFYLRKNDGTSMTCGALLMATGGLAAPKSGSDGSANALIRSLGHSIRRQLPALVPLITNAEYCKALSGLRLNAGIDLFVGGEAVQHEYGQVQFTDYGLSGIPVFQLSAAASAALQEKKNVQVCLDLLPDLSLSAITDELLSRIHLFSGDDMQTMLNGFLPKKMVVVLCRLCGIRPSAALWALSSDTNAASGASMSLPEQLLQMSHLCKALFQTVTGTKGFDMAQTTAGGVPAQELTTAMGSRIMPGLFFAGEIVNVCGRCGGYNLHWAWASGMAAANAAADYIGR